MSGSLLSFCPPLWLIPVLGTFVFFDVHYFWRGILVGLIGSVKRSLSRGIKPLDECTYHGICLSTDLDWLIHMNNARYLRECDFGRILLFTSSGIRNAVKKLGGSIVLGGSTIRYRKPLHFLERFCLKTKILCWDDKAFYLVQKFERKRDKFVCAIVYAKQNLINVSPSAVMHEVIGQETPSPPMPEEVRKWVECNEISSKNLRKID